ncbi:hypothetical protein OIU84_027588 [Salix udensis]|uniref:HTH myb-type domain-containing protein n=1 Tax=Salix udensis TaxID=889485 RepID=A0AAD6PB42_9ROSI|nr:hypothetical protein OIU84_027588 [Salix udensis]
MHHHHQHQGNNFHSSSRNSIPSENHLFLQVGNGPGDSGLILSTDAKPRLKWTPDLHERFIEAVNQLGGAEKATPKTIMKRMGIPGLTLYHLKSHLQKYRLSKNLLGQANSGSNKIGTVAMVGDRMSEVNATHINNLSIGSETNKSLHFSEALQVQIEVQRRLHEQIEVQRHLQLRIEAQGKYLQSVLEKAQETLGRQNLGSVPTTNTTDPKEKDSHRKEGAVIYPSVPGGGLMKGRSEYGSFQDKITNKRVPYFATSKLDLNSHGEIDAGSGCGQLDLNGSSWN